MKIANIQRFCMHDGPGIRTTVFLKGCPLRCAWCHNPETQSIYKEILFYKTKCINCGACTVCPQGAHTFTNEHSMNRLLCNPCGACAEVCPTGALELYGMEYSVEEVYDIIKRDSAFYGARGGITLSGGEPFMQAEEVISLLKCCKQNGIHTAIETCGCFHPDLLKRIVPLCDLFLWDIKDTCSERHKQYTGVSNEQIISNLMLADALGAKTCLRCILVSGINTEESHYRKLSHIFMQLKYAEGIDIIPYHSYGDSKNLALGRTNSGKDNWIPSGEQISFAKEYLRKRAIPVLEVS